MTTRNELVFQGSREKLDEFIDQLSRATGPWTIQPSSGSSFAKRFGRPLPGRRFVGPVEAGQSAGPRLYLAPRTAGKLYVATIAAGDTPARPLTADEYNSYLAAFAAHAAPHARATGVEMVGPGPRTVDLSEYTTPYVFALAEQFRTLANPAALHPLDRKRWRAFAVRAYQDGGVPSRSVVHDWLAQHGWEEAQIGPLLGDYEAAMAVLSEYDEAASQT